MTERVALVCLLLLLLAVPCGARAGGGGRTGGGTTTSAPPRSAPPNTGSRPPNSGYTVPPYIPPPPSYPTQPMVRNGSGPLIPAEKTPAGIRTGIGWVSWLILLVLLVPALIIVYFVYAFFRSMSMARQAARDTFEHDRPSVEVTKLTPRDPLESIRAHDAEFNEQVFLDRARTAFTAIQDSWEKRSLDEVRQYLTVETTTRFQIQIDEMKTKAERNVLDNLVIQGARVVAAGSEGGVDSITVRFEATMVDYILDEKTGRMVDGSMKPRPFVELWTFVRNIASSSNVSTPSSTCAACGAPSSGGAACGYCGNAGGVANGIGWVLSTIDQVV